CRGRSWLFCPAVRGEKEAISLLLLGFDTALAVTSGLSPTAFPSSRPLNPRNWHPSCFSFPPPIMRVHSERRRLRDTNFARFPPEKTAGKDAQRFYADRASRGDCHHHDPDGHPVSGLHPGQGQGAADLLREQAEAVGQRHADLRAGLRRDVPAPLPGSVVA